MKIRFSTILTYIFCVIVGGVFTGVITISYKDIKISYENWKGNEKRLVQFVLDKNRRDILQGEFSNLFLDLQTIALKLKVSQFQVRDFLKDETLSINRNYHVDLRNIRCFQKEEFKEYLIGEANCLTLGSAVYFDHEGKVPVLSVTWKTIPEKVNEGVLNLKIYIIVFLFSTLIFYFFTKNFITYFFSNRLDSFFRDISHIDFSNINIDLFTLKRKYSNIWFFELNRLIQVVISEIQRNVYLSQEVAKKDIDRKFNQLAKQVAHDIKSPLSALEIVMEDIRNLPEESRELTLHAINRIQDIANNLSKDGNLIDDALANKILISPLVASVITEKSVEYQSHHDLVIEFRDLSNRCNFVEGIESDLARALSNIVNNSVEALEGIGQINIELLGNEESIFLKVVDSGKGFPESLIAEGVEKGRTINKEGGQGLGLHHAKTVVESFGGKLELSNIVEGGAQILITLPISLSPEWFKSELNLSSYKQVYIVDDDKSIHDLWKKHLDIHASGLVINDIYDSAKAESSIETIQKDSLILLDYDLRSPLTGIDIIEKYKLKNVCLVTSNYDTPEVLDFCLENSIQLIPKQIVTSIKIV